VPAVLAALLAAALFGVASALQHEQAGAVEASRSPGLLLDLARRPRWLLGIGADIGAVVLQAVALGLGTVALVQPLLVAGLPVAVALSAALEHRRLLRREVIGVLLCTVGLALLGPAAAGTTTGQAPSRPLSFLVGAGIAAAVGGLLLAAHQVPGLAPGLAGAAAGLVIGAGSVLLAVAAGRVGDLPALAHSVAPYAAVVVALLGLLLAQSAFQTGALGAPLAALSVSEPVVAVVLAVTLLHEQLPTGAASRAGLVAGAVLAVSGVLVLCRDAPRPVS